ncbi:MAG: peptidoglycan DD-metalloendopeptidase family protein [Cellvibrionaceae bacterium]|nr:peptidoglycan DD-metalloendopeptidase family protein [Cellvibrionaceae bacterium]
MYRIAQRYNLDYRSLAQVNGINSRYEIYPGQQLKLSGVALKRAWQQSPAIYVAPPVRSNPPQPIYTGVNPSRPTYPVAVAAFGSNSSKKTTATAAGRTNWSPLTTPGSWDWPTNGQLVRDFRGSGSLHKGIDIRGKLGEPVRAAAAGKVVYAGDGLRSYGNLVIVKHDDKFLSAYAHNRRILVTEGVTVAQGQRIAEMGSSGTDSVKLHFEIRYDGNPVDPLQYLQVNR